MSFGSDLQGTPKTDNHAKAMPAKIELRRRIIDAIGADKVRVLDCFAGSGKMADRAWKGAASYVGCDLRWELSFTHTSFACDNRRLLRALDLAAFTVFDLDAYGSPWEQATIIAARRSLAPGERIGFALTDGSEMRGRLGRVERCLAELAGVHTGMKGASREWPALTARAMAEIARRMGGAVEHLWQTEGTHRAIRYSACVVKRA